MNEINKSGVATASVDDNGKLVVTGSGSNTVQIGYGASTTAALALTAAQAGTVNTAFGLASADYTTGITATGGNSAVRSNLIQQFNDLRTQIDGLAEDAGYNGTNLLAGQQAERDVQRKDRLQPEQSRRAGPDDLVVEPRRPDRRDGHLVHHL